MGDKKMIFPSVVDCMTTVIFKYFVNNVCMLLLISFLKIEKNTIIDKTKKLLKKNINVKHNDL